MHFTESTESVPQMLSFLAGTFTSMGPLLTKLSYVSESNLNVGLSAVEWQLQVMESLDMLLPALLDSLSAPSEHVVVETLTVQASIAKDEVRFRHLIGLLLDRCGPLAVLTNSPVLENTLS